MQCNVFEDFCILAGKQTTLDSRTIFLMKCCRSIYLVMYLNHLLPVFIQITVFFNHHLQNYDVFYTFVPQKNAKIVLFIRNKQKTFRIQHLHPFQLSPLSFFSFSLASFRNHQLFHIVYHIPSFLTRNFRASFLIILRDAEETYTYFTASFSLRHHKRVICHLCGAAVCCQRTNLINFH